MEGRHWFTSDEVFLNNALQVLWHTISIPDPFWVNDGNGALNAYSEAIGFGATNERLWLSKTELL